MGLIVEELQVENAALQQRIAELEAALNRFHKQAERFRIMIDRAIDSVEWFLPDGSFFDVNETACTMLGYTREELLSMRIFDIDPFFTENQMEPVWEDLKQRRLQIFEAVHRHKDGHDIPVEVMSNWLELEGQEYACTFVRDITERKQAEAELQQSEERLRLVLEATNDGIWDWNIVTGEVYYSPRWKAMLGYASDELANIPGTWECLLHPDDAPQTYKTINSHVQGYTDSFAVEFRLRMKSGEWKWIQGRGKIVTRDEHGQPVRMIGMHTDISERKRQERDLKLFKTLVENAPDAIAVGDTHTHIIYANPAYKASTGYGEAIIGMKALQVIVEEDHVMMAKALQKLDTQGSANVLTTYRRRDGSTFPVEITSFQIEDDDEQVQLIAFVRDITERKQAEHRLRLAQFSLDRVTDTILWTNQDGIIENVNDTACTNLGYTHEELLGMTVFDFTHSYEDQTEAVLHSLEERGVATFEVVHRHKDGHDIPVEIISHKLIFQGRVYICSLARDITERKRIEADLRMTQFTMDHAPDGIYWISGDRSLRYVNNAACTMLGYTHEELLGMRIFDIDFSTTEEQLKAIGQGLRQRGVQIFETTHRHKNGYDIPVEIVVSYIAFEEHEYSCAFARNITERKQHEYALQETQQFLQIIIDTIPQAIFWKDRNSMFLGCNRFFAEAAGLASTEEVIGKNDFAMPWIEYAEKYRADDRHVMAFNAPLYDFEEPFTDAMGNYHWLRTSKVPLSDTSGTVVAVLGLFEDITERKQMEYALRLSEARYRAVVTHIPDTAFGIFDRQWRILLADGMHLEPLGYTKAQLEGRLLSEVVSYVVFDRVKPLISAAFEGETVTFEHEFAGSVYRLLYVPIHDEQNQVMSVLSITQDISRQRQAEYLLRESEERYRIISELISDYAAACTVEQDGTITIDWVTMGFLRALETQFDGLRNEWRDFVHIDDHLTLVNVIQQVLNGQAVSYEVRVVARNGTLRWLSTHIRPIWDPGENRVVRIFSAAQDITERKAVEAERTALVHDLEARNAELERFTYTVSHDLKSPLITIKGYLGYLERDALAGNIDRLKSDLIRIEQAADRMQQLLDELLELSRIGRLINPSEWISLHEIIHDALLMIAGHLQSKNIHITIADQLPHVYGDRIRLREVFQNLLDNAIKFMDQQPEPQIDIGVRPGPNPPVIYVHDNGGGIDPQYCKKIFGLFEKLNARSPGTGIGLALAKRIIEAHGGQIWAESDGPGTGATFCFTIPAPEVYT